MSAYAQVGMKESMGTVQRMTDPRTRLRVRENVSL